MSPQVWHAARWPRFFNKGHQTFTSPFPTNLTPLLRACADSRVDWLVAPPPGCLGGRTRPKWLVNSTDDILAHFDHALVSVPENEVQSPQDTKRLFRTLLRHMGGISEDGLAKEFKPLHSQVGLPNWVRFYDLRASCNSEMDRSHVSHLVQRYVTGHETRDSMREYVSLEHAADQMANYFDFISPLLAATEERAHGLGIAGY